MILKLCTIRNIMRIHSAYIVHLISYAVCTSMKWISSL